MVEQRHLGTRKRLPVPLGEVSVHDGGMHPIARSAQRHCQQRSVCFEGNVHELLKYAGDLPAVFRRRHGDLHQILLLKHLHITTVLGGPARPRQTLDLGEHELLRVGSEDRRRDAPPGALDRTHPLTRPEVWCHGFDHGLVVLGGDHDDNQIDVGHHVSRVVCGGYRCAFDFAVALDVMHCHTTGLYPTQPLVHVWRCRHKQRYVMSFAGKQASHDMAAIAATRNTDTQLGLRLPE
mmetsp:Transcript_6245/g.17946  ORF Transcript_6245/g.17946 Transcript_6245/m.17946 type:complete len:236 (+) Transcript_6245:1162-1869(+)